MTEESDRGTPAKPMTLGGPEFIIAIDDEHFDRMAPIVREAFGRDGLPLSIVLASTLANPYGDSDLYYGAYRPTEPGFVRLYQTSALETFEQAPDGRIFRQGKQVWPEAPVAIGRPTANIEDLLVQGEDAALCFVTGERLRITHSGTLLFLWCQPKVKTGPRPTGWLAIARRNRGSDPRAS